jgi:hypothetical protein
MHRKLAEQLVSAHKDRSKNAQELEYEYDQQQKGISCRSCNSFITTVNLNKLVCDNCGAIELVEDGVLRCVEEIKILFPERKITTKLVQEWCMVIESKKIIREILKRNMKSTGYGQWTYFE